MIETVERHQRRMGLADPGGLELRTIGDYEQNSVAANKLFDLKLERL